MKQDDLTRLVYIVDDDFSVRDSLRLLIEATGQTVRQFESAEAFLHDYNHQVPSCLVLDVNLPGMDGLGLQQQLAKKDIAIPIIFISGHAGIPDSAKAFRAGAVDFLKKPLDTALLIERINEALRKDTEAWQERRSKLERQERIDRLTDREKEVLHLIMDSYSNKEAARILGISYRTIDLHRAHIMEKLEAGNIVGLIRIAMYNNELNNKALCA
ncbi:response regulator transcription factor [Methylovulum psychrotolerans]|uniref:Nitrogen regulation protein NR(I) n=1 Tax=Methylovulum psychrotolerans TaxID=1704499 RepID=A0A2S5CGB8_9GAMM|nr:response regulator [Methylovulum psychrotolerans]POZ49850.1 nitrogen regulation protein NR(I) [Methylovulum psychrotolerans]